jgi:hypothetical protein
MTDGGAADDTLRVLYGTDVPPPRRLRLSAGALSAELVDGSIRRLAWNGVEIVRCISFLIRDEGWGTLPGRLDEPEVAQDGRRFQVRLRGSIDAAGASFAFVALIEGDEGGSFTFAVKGRPDADILSNRAGFVVLHPAAFAGRPVTLLGVDGRKTDVVFPEAISPAQPFFDLRGLRYRLPGAGTITCRMDASLPTDPLGKFETEDQRNWCDASFKTYVGSLLDPHPYRLEAGQTFAQSVIVAIAPASDPVPAPGAIPAPAGCPGPMPTFGIGVPHGAHSADSGVLAAVLGLPLSWMLVEADLRRPDVAAHLAACARISAGRSVRLDIVAPARAEPEVELAEAARLCIVAGLRPDAVLVVPGPYLKSHQPTGRWPDLPPLDRWYAAARAAFARAAVGGGMMTNFTELNRKRPSPEGLAFIAHSTTAIVHDADDAAVMETLETLKHIGTSVRALWPGVPWQLGPSSIAMRSNPYGASDPQNQDWLRMPLADRDPRQRGLYGAAWTMGFAAAATDAGATLVGLHASHGHLGLVDEDGLRPCFHVLAALARASGRRRVFLAAGEGLTALAWEDGGGVRAMVANLTDEDRELGLAGAGRVLDARSVRAARTERDWAMGSPAPLPDRLGPYAVAFLTA